MAPRPVPRSSRRPGTDLFDGPFSWPVMVAKRSALEANIATMAAYCARHGVDLAPHGKTTMAPTLFAAQLAAGAWGITVATANQALVARRFGVPRVLLANEMLDPNALRWAAAEVGRGWEFLFYVDSLAGVCATTPARRRADAGPMRVFVEMGYSNGRTGCRTVEQASAVARKAAATDGLELAGVAGFEGLLPDRESVSRFLDDMVDVAGAVADLCPYPLIVSASAAARSSNRGGTTSRARPRIRAGGCCCAAAADVTHDHGLYAKTTPFLSSPPRASSRPRSRSGPRFCPHPNPGSPSSAPADGTFPSTRGCQCHFGARRTDGATRPLADALIDGLNDQHAYLRGARVAPGELVRLGISHPCTAFDRWRVIPVVDDDYRVADLLDTYF